MVVGEHDDEHEYDTTTKGEERHEEKHKAVIDTMRCSGAYDRSVHDVICSDRLGRGWRKLVLSDF